jgi:tetratricopeptide (TPR) repeat protein
MNAKSCRLNVVSRLKTPTLVASFAIVMFSVSAPLGPPAYAQASAEAAKPAETLRPELGKELKAAQELINAKQFKEALAKLAEADKIAAKTPYEVYILERLRGPAAAAISDHTTAARSFQIAVDSGRLTIAERTQFSEAITSAFYLLKDYKSAAAWAKRSIESGGAAPQTRMLMIQALVLGEDLPTATKEANAAIADDEKAGKTPTQELLRLAGTIALRSNDDTAYVGVLERLVVAYPSNDYWLDYIARVARNPVVNERYMTDIFRLKMTLGQPLTASQYMFVAQSAKQAGFPIEAAKVMEAGFKAGALSSAEHKQFRDLVDRDAADDVKNMARTSAEAARAKEGPGLFNSGLNYVYNGESDKGLPMMEQGISRSGIRRPEDARLRLGIAYAIAGERAKAVETLAMVQSVEGGTEVARLWTAYAKQRVSGASSAPALPEKK